MSSLLGGWHPERPGRNTAVLPGDVMTARACITRYDIARAVEIAKTEGVTVTITAPNGKSYTIAPPLDVKGESDQAHDSFEAWRAKREARREGRA